MRLHRPNIPLAIRCQVAERQMKQAVGCLPTNKFGVFLSEDTRVKLRTRLDATLFHIACILGCDVKDLRLDHDPALGARPRKGEGKKTVYDPPANSPAHLIYREKHAHLIKTNVRGEHGQHPDRVLIKKERRRKNKKQSSPKRRWPSRPLQGRSTWPKRKFRSKKA